MVVARAQRDAELSGEQSRDFCEPAAFANRSFVGEHVRRSGRQGSCALALSLAGWAHGCAATSMGPRDADFDDVVTSDALGADRAVFATCARPLSGLSPFAVSMAGGGSYRWDRPAPTQVWVSRNADVFFPAGRAEGAPVLIAQTVAYPHIGLHVETLTLGPEDRNVGFRDPRIVGVSACSRFALGGPGDGLLMCESRANLAVGTDVEFLASGWVQLCPTGEIPAARISSEDAWVAPLSTFWLGTTTPVAPAALSAIRLRAGDVEVPIEVRGEQDSIRMSPLRAIPPNQQVIIDVSGVRDVLGRSVRMRSQPQTLVTASQIVDMLFERVPPDGSITSRGTSVEAVDGALVIGSSTSRDVRGDVLVALPDAPAGSIVRLDASLHCSQGLSYQAALVDATGAVRRVALDCTEGVAARTPSPGAGPIWLAVRCDPPRWNHQLPPRSTSASITIRSIHYE